MVQSVQALPDGVLCVRRVARIGRSVLFFPYLANPKGGKKMVQNVQTQPEVVPCVLRAVGFGRSVLFFCCLN